MLQELQAFIVACGSAEAITVSDVIGMFTVVCTGYAPDDTVTGTLGARIEELSGLYNKYRYDPDIGHMGALGVMEYTKANFMRHMLSE